MKNKKRLTIIVVLLILFSSFYSYKMTVTIKTGINSEKKAYVSKNTSRASTFTYNNYYKGFRLGFFRDSNENVFKNDERFNIENSSILNFGVYTHNEMTISYDTFINNQIVKGESVIESTITGFGSSTDKMNNFRKVILKNIDKDFSGIKQ